jgi:hypothetical protein
MFFFFFPFSIFQNSPNNSMAPLKTTTVAAICPNTDQRCPLEEGNTEKSTRRAPREELHPS